MDATDNRGYYVYVDYFNTDPPKPFYVGQGLRRRVADNVDRTELYKYIVGDRDWYRVVVDGPISGEESVIIESQLIRYLHTMNHEGGANAHRRSRFVRRSPEARANMSAACTGRKHTPETRAKISATLTGRKLTPEAVAKTAAFNRGKKRSPETVAKTAAFNRGKKRSPEMRARMSAAQRKRYAREREARGQNPTEQS